VAQLDRVIGKIEGLPTLPTVVARINQLIEDPTASAGDINEVISRDLALSSKILKVVNSAFYGFPRRISSMTHAVVILGFNTVRNIALSAFIFDAFDTRELAFGHRAFWLHSVGTGVASQVVAVHAGLAGVDDAFVGGLLHDVGKVIMHQHLADDLKQVIDRAARDDISFVEAERYELGYSHAELGALLMENWKLPVGLVDSLRYHHDPQAAGEQSRQAAAAVHLGDYLCRALLIGSGGDAKMPPLVEAAWAGLGLTEADLPEILGEISTEMSKATAFIDLIRPERGDRP
jgi:HD-like signal output (HDOD) protein